MVHADTGIVLSLDGLSVAVKQTSLASLSNLLSKIKFVSPGGNLGEGTRAIFVNVLDSGSRGQVALKSAQ